MSLSSLFLLAELPAVPTDSSGRYVAAAFLVVFVLLGLYLAIMAQRLRRVQALAEQLEADFATIENESTEST